MKMDLALDNLQRLICHKTHQTKPNQRQTGKKCLFLNMEVFPQPHNSPDFTSPDFTSPDNCSVFL